MYESWTSLVPPIMVLIVGISTRRVLTALVCGILSAAFIATDFSIINTIKTSISRLWDNIQLETLLSTTTFWNNSNLFICMFLCILGIIVTLIGHSGGANAYVRFVRSKIQTRKGAETSSLLLSMFLFIDDYFSSLTVGSVMHPLTDHFQIPRAKLAFLVDSMAAPLAVLMPISSWVAAIIGFLSENGVGKSGNSLIYADPFSIYLNIIPYMFYSFIIIPCAWIIVRKRISYGLMYKHEKIAKETGNLFAGKPPVSRKIRTAHARNVESSSILDFIFPITSLFLSVIGGMLYAGNYKLFGGNRNLVEAFQNSKASIALFTGGSLALVLCILFFLYRKKLYAKEIPHECLEGIKLMLPAITILMLSWTLGDLLRDDLRTGQYVANTLLGTVNISFFPLMFFIASAATSFALGTSWGTMAIMFPIAIPMVISFLKLNTPTTIDHITILFPILGAIISGAVSGDHISPLSDTTIMSSTSCGSYHIDHVQTQMTYAIPVLIAVSVSYLTLGRLIVDEVSLHSGIAISSLVGLFVALAIMFIMNKLQKR